MVKKKTNNIFSLFFNSDFPEDKIFFPFDSKNVKKNENSLIGKIYYFFNFEETKILSPIKKGFVSKIYSNNIIKIKNNKNLQILLNVQVSENNEIKKIIKCEVKEKQIINRKTILFSVFLESEINCVSIYIPYQPEIIKKIISSKKNKEKIIAKIWYRKKKIKFKEKNNNENVFIYNNLKKILFIFLSFLLLSFHFWIK